MSVIKLLLILLIAPPVALFVGLLVGLKGGLTAWEVARAFIMLAWALGAAAFFTGGATLVNLTVIAFRRKKEDSSQDSENKLAIFVLAILSIASPIWVFILSIISANR